MTTLRGTTVPLDSLRPFKMEDQSFRYRLTPAEREVACLLAAGRTTHEIAAVRGIASKSVDFAISHILGKLGVMDRREALPLLHGLLAGEDSQVTSQPERRMSCQPW